MKRTLIVFGLISGAVSSTLMLVTLPMEGRIGYDKALVVGYTSIVLSFLLVYFGIRSYRDNIGGGRITFAKAFGVGLGITLISCLVYVAAWEVAYYNFMPDFMDKYSAREVQALKAAGGSPAAVEAKLKQMDEYRRIYANPLLNGAMTFIEPFPVGLVITLLSAALLRRKTEPGSAALPVADPAS